ncbi:hypothetical protein M408DRAFT_36724, partial [Serendipita vermifera MAFF 305830]
EMIFGMDETCGWGDTAERQKVIGATGKRVQVSQRNITRESTTLIVSVSADGKVLRPYCIFKVCILFLLHFISNSHFRVNCSPNAYTSDDIALDWLDHFENETKELANGRKRLLLLDGHRSHHTWDFLQKARSLGIICLGYPPHTTHVLQCLDVVGFSQFKRGWASLLFSRGQTSTAPVSKDNYLHLIEGPFLKAFTPSNIKAGFKKTGVCPFNSTVVTPSMMAPSIANSANALFPMPQTSPVRA